MDQAKRGEPDRRLLRVRGSRSRSRDGHKKGGWFVVDSTSCSTDGLAPAAIRAAACLVDAAQHAPV